MKSLRILWGSVLTIATWALALGCCLFPVQGTAAEPQAPMQRSMLTITTKVNPGSISLSGSLTVDSKPVAGAAVSIALDAKKLGTYSTGADGRYSAISSLPAAGSHIVTATYAGDSKFKPSSASVNFSLSQPATKTPTSQAPTTQAPPPAITTAQSAAEPKTTDPTNSSVLSNITAALSPNPIEAGGVLSVSGKLTSSGAPIDSASVDISCDFGGDSTLGVTDENGAFAASLTIPESGQPSTLNVTIAFAGDGHFQASRSVFQASVTAKSPASPSAAPSTAFETTAPTNPTALVSTSASAVGANNSASSSDPKTPANVFVSVLAIVGASSAIILFALWVIAWSRHDLLPGERRGFGSDFGHGVRSW